MDFKKCFQVFQHYFVTDVIKKGAIMISINTSLMLIFIGTAILMTGIWLFREPRKSLRHTCTECVVWGLGFFLSMSVQVALLATLS